MALVRASTRAVRPGLTRGGMWTVARNPGTSPGFEVAALCFSSQHNLHTATAYTRKSILRTNLQYGRCWDEAAQNDLSCRLSLC